MQKGLWWYEIPKDPKGAWVSHRIGDAVLGAISPNGVIDVNGDGKPDILRGNVWFENKGNGTEWVEVIVN
ncbi:MAG: hypothetical protein JWM04_1210 [Verrucomicrobiales bacterium]|jgi:hypothetical protein|nr:hypothetical protein [Verrucomicrobiales bacterium]